MLTNGCRPVPYGMHPFCFLLDPAIVVVIYIFTFQFEFKTIAQKYPPYWFCSVKRAHINLDKGVFVLLIAYPIKQSTQTNSAVLDGFLGSHLHLLFLCIVI